MRAQGVGRLTILMLALAVPAQLWAEAPKTSLRPLARPVAEEPAMARPAARPVAVASAKGGAAIPLEDDRFLPRPARGAEAAPEGVRLAAALPVPVAYRAAPVMLDLPALPVLAVVPPALAAASSRPRSRPAALAVLAPAAVVAAPAAILSRLRPEPRPRDLARRAAPAPAPERVQTVTAIRLAPGTGPLTGKRGALCGNPALRGEVVAPVVGRVNGCGIARPVRLAAIGDIRLSQPALMDCDTAQALARWVDKGLKPAMAGTGGGVAGLQVAGHYVCRPRNHRAGARISEHGKGKAIDISAIVLANGQKLSILRDWRGPHGPKLKSAHKAACGIFGTTLGPGSDGMHEDHLHFDTARHRNGSYCR